MELREIIIVLGLVAIVIIVLDGLRRMKIKPRRAKRVVEDDDWVDPEEVERKAQLARELPNGGARIREMTQVEKAEIENRLNLRERVPMLMERVEVEGDEPENAIDDAAPMQPELDFSQALQQTKTDQSAKSAHKSILAPKVASAAHIEKQEPTWSLDEPDEELDASLTRNLDHELEADSSVKEAIDCQSEYEQSELKHDDDDLSEDDVDEPAEQPVPDAEEGYEYEDEDEYEADKKDQPAVEVKKASVNQEPAQEELGPVEDIIVIHVMAKGDAQLAGGDILELLLRAGLRHGSMDIFHYRNAQGQTEFSLANCVRPGTFNPDLMSELKTPGLTLFMQLPTGANAMESLDHMVEMAKFMARNLDASVLDETHSTVSGQRIESYREKLRSFARKKLIPS